MTEIDTYLATLPEDQKNELERIRGIVLAMVPDAVETISYGMPTMKYKSRPLLGFASHTSHLSIYPFSPRAVDGAKELLAGYMVSKGIVRFATNNPLPEETLKQIIANRLKELG